MTEEDDCFYFEMLVNIFQKIFVHIKAAIGVPYTMIMTILLNILLMLLFHKMLHYNYRGVLCN